MNVRTRVLSQPTTAEARTVGEQAVALGQLSAGWLTLALRAHEKGARSAKDMERWLAARRGGFRSGAAKRARRKGPATPKPVVNRTAALQAQGMHERTEEMNRRWLVAQ